MRDRLQLRFASDGRIDSDVHCVDCGHNLRGLEPVARCGECGAEVRWSLGGPTLRLGDPGWAQRTRAGIVWMGITLPWLAIPLVWPLFIYGYWRLTALPEHEARLRKPIWPWIGRFVVLGVLVVTGVYVSIKTMGAPWFADALPLLGGALAICLVTFCVAIPLRALARRTSTGMGRALATVLIILTPIGAAFAALGLYSLVSMRNVSMDVGVGIPGVIAAIISVPLLLLLLAMMSARLSAAESAARALRERRGCWLRREPGVTHAASHPPTAPRGEQR